MVAGTGILCSVAQRRFDYGYTKAILFFMKTAVSLPDPLFKRAEKFAREHGLTRSGLVATALTDFLKHRSDENLTEQINRVCSQVDTRLDTVGSEIARRTLLQAEWDD